MQENQTASEEVVFNVQQLVNAHPYQQQHAMEIISELILHHAQAMHAHTPTQIQHAPMEKHASQEHALAQQEHTGQAQHA